MSLEQVGLLGGAGFGLSCSKLCGRRWSTVSARLPGITAPGCFGCRRGAVPGGRRIAALDPVADWRALLGLGAAFMFLAATQDVATDGLAVRLLWESDRGLGNGIQVGGYYLGQILGGGWCWFWSTVSAGARRWG